MIAAGAESAAPFRIGLIGCGHMGQAMLRGWLNAGINADYRVVEPAGLPEKFKASPTVSHISDLKTEPQSLQEAHIIVLAVKPQVMDNVCRTLIPYISNKAAILSIAAGRSIESFEKIFGKTQPIIRTMPNLAASVGESMTVAHASPNVSGDQKRIANLLLQCVGKVEWFDHENLVNIATALVGNGPAYVFYLMEILAKSIEKAGIEESMSKALARQTVIGGALLAASSPETEASVLRKNVTSPGGTTEAALKILMNGELQQLFDDAVAAAIRRGNELSG